MKEQKNPRKPIIYYYIAAMVMVMLLNAFVFPLLIRQKINQVDYGTFLTQIENGKVRVVEIEENQIGFITVDDEGKENMYGGSQGERPF